MSVRISLFVFLLFCVSALSTAEKPNVILVMTDDMGYSDIGCYGSEIATPNLDNLASGGLRFTQFYNTARCCSTRASLLTGLHPHQAGMGHMTYDGHLPGYRGDLSPESVTIAEALKSSTNYKTYAVGKWHVSENAKPDGSKHNWPIQRGFDKFYGLITGAGNYFDPTLLVRGNTPITAFSDPEYKPDGEYYITYALTDNAVKFIKEHKKDTPEQPFFMYLTYTAAHWPMQAPEKAIKPYEGKYDAGYQKIREERFAKQKELGLIPADLKLSPQAEDWDKVENKAWEARCMEVYAAMITEMDKGIGKVVDSLKETGQYENTVILYLQDNGACAENIGRNAKPNYLTQPEKPLFDKIPDNEPVFANRDHTREGYPIRKGRGVMPGPKDTFIAYGRGWANVSNTPFREYKHWVHEGGISTPLLVHSPSKVAESLRGKFIREPGQLPDIHSTILELAGGTYPKQYNGNTITPAEGTSLTPLFTGEKISRTKPLVWEHEGNRAIRVGNDKLVAKGPQGAWEFYDILNDRSELHDIAAQNAETVKQLAEQWHDWAVRAKVLPWLWDKKTITAVQDVAPDKTKGVKLLLDFTKEDKITDISGKKNTLLTTGTLKAVKRNGNVSALYFDGSSHIEADKSSALHCAETPLSIEAIIEPETENAVIAASGGSRFGYSLFLKDGKPGFAVRNDSEVYIALSDKTVKELTTLKGVLSQDKKVEIYVNGEKSATADIPEFISEDPAETLQIGTDLGGSVSGLKQPPFKGYLHKLEIRRL